MRFVLLALAAILLAELAAIVLRIPPSWRVVRTLPAMSGRDIHFSPDGTLLITAGRKPQVWDAETCERVADLDHARGSRGAVCPDSSKIATVGYEGVVRAWEARTGRLLWRKDAHAGAIRTVEFSPDGARIVTASSDHTAAVWDAETGARVVELAGHTAELASAAFSPDGRRVVTASRNRVTVTKPGGRSSTVGADDPTARVWDAGTGECLLVIRERSSCPSGASWSPDGKRILTRSGDPYPRVWDAGTGKLLLEVGSGHGNQGNPVYSPDGKRIVTAGLGSLKVWDAETGKLLAKRPGHYCIASLELSRDGRYILSSDYLTTRIWDARDLRCVGALRGLGMDLDLDGVAFSPDGGRAATYSFDGFLRIWAP